MLETTQCPEIKVDLSSIKGLDHEMMDSILLGPFKGPFRGVTVEMVLRSVNMADDLWLRAMQNAVQFAGQRRSDCNGIQSLDISDNGLWPRFESLCQTSISGLFCLETLCIDFNFVGGKKKGAHRGNMEALCAALSKLPLLRQLSIRGDFARSGSQSEPASHYLTADDLQPLLQFLSNTVSDEYGDSPCCLETLCLDGNRLKDDGCKAIAKSLATNRRLVRLSMEHNKCSFKGFLRIIDSIVAAEEAVPSSIKLCALPLSSILKDPGVRSKIKKHRQQIERCTAIIERNATDNAKHNAEVQLKQHSMPMDVMEVMDQKEGHSEIEADRSPNDELAQILKNSKLRPTVKPIDDGPPIQQQPGGSAKGTKFKVVKTGTDALVDKGSTAQNVKNAKSRRKKRTRKKIEI